MTDKELSALRAQCLINASNILAECSTLTEGAATDAKKAIMAKAKAIKLDQKDSEEIKKILKGDADPKEAKKYFDEAIKAVDGLIEEAKKIPEETSSEALIKTICSKEGAIGTIASFLIGAASGTMAMSSNLFIQIASIPTIIFGIITGTAIINKAGEYVPEDTGKLEYNVTKKKAIVKLTKLKLRLVKLYNKKYGKKEGKVMKESVNISSKYRTLQEAISILMEEASAADNIEDAQDLIEKAKDLQDKAIDMLDDTADKIDGCEDGKCDKKEDKKEEKKEDTKADSLQEAVNALLTAAVMCESAEEADGYIQKAEELQKAIDEIPEEKPEDARDYPETTSGGDEMKEDHLEAIKDLVDDDKDALDILTVDEDSLTID